jgi:hypothetical protein
MRWFKKRKKLKRYVVYSTNHDKLMDNECDRVVIVSAENDSHMYELLEHMEPVNPNEFLIFEEIL